MECNGTLLYGFDYDRRYFLDAVECLQVLLPAFNSLTVHPAMLILLWKMPNMRPDLRVGYILTELTFICYDWLLNFAIRLYGGLPYAVLYCGGPLCNLIGVSTINFLLAIMFTVNIPCFLFLLGRMHHHVANASRSVLALSERTQLTIFTLHIIINTLNIVGFVVYGKESDNAMEIASECELRWMTERGGRLIVFGTFGDPQYFKTELYLLGATIAISGPIPIILTIDSIRCLRTKQITAVSQRTHKISSSLLRVFNLQLSGVLILITFPLISLFATMLIDYHESTTGFIMALMRAIVAVALILDPFHFALIFVINNWGLRKVRLNLSKPISLSHNTSNELTNTGHLHQTSQLSRY